MVACAAVACDCAQAELDRLQTREKELQDELQSVQASITELEDKRKDTVAKRDGTSTQVGAKLGTMAITEAQVRASPCTVLAMHDARCTMHEREHARAVRSVSPRACACPHACVCVRAA